MVRDKSLRIELTDEQARLYVESAAFHLGVDAFLRGVVPAFLEGLAARAVRTDSDIESRLRAALDAEDGDE